VTATAHVIHEHYANGDRRPLRGYVVLASGYAALAASVLALARRRQDEDRTRIGWDDLARTAVATHRVSRILTKDAIASPLRAPLTRYEGPGLPGEVTEQVAPAVKRQPVLHALAELVTCPFCAGQWVATVLVAGQIVAPRATRLLTGILTAAAGADALHFVHAGLQRLEPPAPGTAQSDGEA
jgi:Protein of unknown function (DUF1360)